MILTRSTRLWPPAGAVMGGALAAESWGVVRAAEYVATQEEKLPAFALASYSSHCTMWGFAATERSNKKLEKVFKAIAAAAEDEGLPSARVTYWAAQKAALQKAVGDIGTDHEAAIIIDCGS